MKKILVCFVAALALTGCGSSKVSKTCSMDTGGLKMSLTAEAKSEKENVSSLMVKQTITYDGLGLDGAKMSDKEKSEYTEQMSDAMKAQFGESVKVDVTYDKKNVIINTTLKAGEYKAFLNTDKDINLSDFVKNMEAQKATCK